MSILEFKALHMMTGHVSVAEGSTTTCIACLPCKCLFYEDLRQIGINLNGILEGTNRWAS
jgi:hypothetical protein